MANETSSSGTGPVGVRSTTTTTEKQNIKKRGSRPSRIRSSRHAETSGTQTNVPEAGGESVRYRQETGAGRRGKQSSDVFLVGDPAGGEAGRVGVSTLGGGMKYKAASVSPEGKVSTKFISPFRAKRARQAIEATPSVDSDEKAYMSILGLSTEQLAAVSPDVLSAARRYAEKTL